MANDLITAAYVVIPILLLDGIRIRLAIEERGEEPPRFSAHESRVLLVWFGLFILFCGIGHQEARLAFFWPYYPAFAIWDLCTAIVSWVTVILLIPHRSKLASGAFI